MASSSGVAWASRSAWRSKPSASRSKSSKAAPRRRFARKRCGSASNSALVIAAVPIRVEVAAIGEEGALGEDVGERRAHVLGQDAVEDEPVDLARRLGRGLRGEQRPLARPQQQIARLERSWLRADGAHGRQHVLDLVVERARVVDRALDRFVARRPLAHADAAALVAEEGDAERGQLLRYRSK